MKDRGPRLKAPSFVCPHCEAFAQQEWPDVLMRHRVGQGTTVRQDHGLEASRCAVCERYAIWRTSTGVSEDGPFINLQLLYPSGLAGPPAPEDLHPDLLSLYEEARSVASLSPRSASALVRLTLEGLLNHLYPDAGNLNEMIGAAAKAGLPDDVVRAMDVLRFNGNASVHELHREDTTETVAALFKILHVVVERLVTQPRQIAELHAALPEGVRKQIEKRDG